MQGVQGRYSSATGESRGEEIENKSVSGIMSSSAVVTAIIALLRRGAEAYCVATRTACCRR